MNHSDIAALMKGAAPVIADLVAASVRPLLERIDDLERQVRDRDDADMVRALVADAVAAIPPAAPGRDGGSGKDGIDGLPGKDGLPGADGKSVDLAEVEALVSESVAKAVAAIPAPQHGKDGRDGADGKDGAEGQPGLNGKDGERGLEGPAGKLPIAKTFETGVHYESSVVTHGGATYQALKDTANEPPHEDWVCIAAAGRDGADGRSFTIRGTYAASNEYQELDVVALNGGAFVAKKNEPGECPGADWQLIASQGKAGKPGERGMPGRGDRGEPGQPVVAAAVDDMGLLTLVNGDGSKVEVDLYPLLAKVAHE